MGCLLATLGVASFFGFSCTVLFPAFAPDVLDGGVGAYSFLTSGLFLLPNLLTFRSPGSLVWLVLAAVAILIPSILKEAVTSQGSRPGNES